MTCLKTPQDLLPATLEPLLIEQDPYLYQRQMELEQLMKGSALEVYDKSYNNTLSSGNMGNTSTGFALISRFVSSVEEGIREWYEEATLPTTKGGRRLTAAKVLSRFDNFKVVAAIALTNCINFAGREETNRHQIYKAIATELEAELHLREARKQDQRLYTMLKRAVDTKQDLQHKIDAWRFVSSDAGIVHKAFTDSERTHVSHLLVEICKEKTGLFQLDTVSKAKHGSYKDTYVISYTKDAQDLIDKRTDIARHFVSQHWPMCVPPLDWEEGNLIGRGYISNAQSPLQLVKALNKRITNEYNNFSMPDVLRSVNIAQRTPWCINKDVLELVRLCVEREVTLKKLDLRKPNPIHYQSMSNMLDRDIMTRVSAWRAEVKRHNQVQGKAKRRAELEGKPFTKTELPRPYDISEEEYERYLQLKAINRHEHQRSKKYRTQSANVNALVSIADMYKEFAEIYMPYTLDFRGRFNCVSALSPQGADHSKALLHFAKGEKITKKGIEWVYFHMSGLMDYDKANKGDRVQFVKDQMDIILELAANPLGSELFYTSKKPFQLYACAKEIEGIQKHGTNWVTRQPIALDGSCSGIQHYSALLQDEIGGQYVNLIPSDVREDIYLAVVERANKIVDEWCSKSIDEAIAEFYKRKHQVRRMTVKQREALTDFSQLVYAKLQEQKLPEDLDELVLANVVECIKGEAGRIYYARQWKNCGIERDTAKRPCMTYSYSATKAGMRDQVYEDYVKALHSHIKGKHKEVIKGQNGWFFDGTGYRAAMFMGDVMWDAIEGTVVKAAEMMNWIKKVCGLIMQADVRKPIRWTTPAGMLVVQDYRATRSSRIACLFMGRVTQINMGSYWDAKARKMVSEPWEASIDPSKSKSGICPNIIHSLDACHLMMILLAASKEGMDSFALVHDSFATTPNKTSRFSEIIRETFIDMYKGGKTLKLITDALIEQVPEALKGKVPPLPTLGKLDLDAIKDSEFCFA